MYQRIEKLKSENEGIESKIAALELQVAAEGYKDALRNSRQIESQILCMLKNLWHLKDDLKKQIPEGNSLWDVISGE